MKLVAFFLVCLGLAECTTLRRPGDKALKDVFVQRWGGNCSRQRATELLQEVTKFKDEVIETNLALTVDNDINAVIPKSFQIMDKLDKCHKEITQFNGPGEPKLENQIVKAIHFALLQVSIQKFRLNIEIMADEL